MSALFPKSVSGLYAGHRQRLQLGAAALMMIFLMSCSKPVDDKEGKAGGETIAVLMVVGNVAQTPTSIFDPALLGHLNDLSAQRKSQLPDHEVAIALRHTN